MDEIKKIYENKVIPFENTDDSYKSKMSAYYSEWSSMGDKFSDVGNAIRDFLAGIGDSLVGTVKGLLTLVVDLGLLYVHSECSRMTLGHVPETLDQEVEKIKQKYEPLFKDPVNTIGGIGQSICDTADEKGVAYSSGYIVTEVVTALLADKGLDKLKNVAKTGKTADNVADIAEGAGKAAENAAEDAAKAGKKLDGAAEDAGKVVEGSSVSNTLTDVQKSRLNVLENTINDHLTDGDFSGTLRDLQGNPVPNGRGGYFDHLGEMQNSYKSLKKIKKALEGSLKNPNLSEVDRALLQEGLDKANFYIDKIEELFDTYGGIN